MKICSNCTFQNLLDLNKFERYFTLGNLKLIGLGAADLKLAKKVQ